MFEQYSESARRVIFWARSEAGRLKFEQIETQHLLLALVREDQDQTRSRLIPKRSFLDPATAAKLKADLAWPGPLANPLPNHADMPLSEELKAVLTAASKYADGSTVGLLHLVIGVMDQSESKTAPCLVDSGITRAQVEQTAQQ